MAIYAFEMGKEDNENEVPPTQLGDTSGGSSSDLAVRAARYNEEVEEIVRGVGEHPLYELKRACVLKDLGQKIEFVKDIQSIATSRINSEKYLVIGADDATKTFCRVRNLDEFDEASIRQILGKYLSPVPEFELFKLTSSEGYPFVLFVIPKQRTRRILSKVTVEDTKDLKPRILLREGDLWTKGSSTGKRLGTPEDWDEIYEERIEIEAEQSARKRTEHMLEMAAARERVKPAGRPSLPSFFTDDEFPPLLEELCGAQDVARFNLLLERLRDELVEGWHGVEAYEWPPRFSWDPPLMITELKERLQEHIKNVFRPAMHWLTLAGLGVVKNAGPREFLEKVVDLLQEVFDTSRVLFLPHALTPPGSTSKSADQHVSHTVPALQSLVTLHLIGAYLTRRKRFEYLRCICRAHTYSAGYYLDEPRKKTLMAFWPLDLQCGEPEELRYSGGRINYCLRRIKADMSYLRLFGSEAFATRALCQYELCLKLNSYLAIPSEDTKESASYMGKAYPDRYFFFRPDLIAFSLENVRDLASALFSEIRNTKPEVLKLVVCDPSLAGFFSKPGADIRFARFMNGLLQEHTQLCMQLGGFPRMVFWPKELGDAMEYAKSIR